MTRHVWVIPANGSTAASGRDAKGSDAEPTQGAATTGRLFGRLRSKGKKHEAPSSSSMASSSMARSSVPEEGGMSAAPDVPARKDHDGPR